MTGPELPRSSPTEQDLADLRADVAATEQLEKTIQFIDAEIAQTPGEVAVIALDLDHLKYFNDRYGHDEGDRYILFAQGILNDCTRHENTRDEADERAPDVILINGTVIHKSGDEFYVITRDVHTQEEVDGIAERLQAELDELGVASSAGGLIHRPGQTARELLIEAEARMRQDKEDRVPQYDDNTVTRLTKIRQELAELAIPPRNLDTIYTALEHRGRIPPLE